ncbi:MAG: putative short-chain dehydrogenase/reductase [Rickettsiaceae bacterium]|jgi:NAD(P)-dependent dehydrogenase (short-subunit alcohol dehydrogenase family)|nr:putative short-chain dehydrogenase/reductase [Rickettsiaceae bacterium]
MHKTALITGGASKIGRELAKALAKDGYDIVLHYNNSLTEAKKLQEEISGIGVKCKIIKADLLNAKEVDHLVEEMKRIENWSVLINNASIFYQSNFLESDIEELEKNFTIHLKVPVLLSKALAQNCTQNQLAGNIINMIDKNITRVETKYFHYLLSKKSLAEFTQMSALQLAPNIRVNAIAPGFISNIDETDPDLEVKKLLTKIPLRKIASEQDIVEGMRYLLNGNFVTGHILFIDGGASLNHAG